jgi:hypothetical protein
MVQVMQIIEEVAVKYGLAALLQEKPFQVAVVHLFVTSPLEAVFPGGEWLGETQ